MIQDNILKGGNANAKEISYSEWQAMTPAERSNGTAYYIIDYPTLGGVYLFETKAAMDAAIQAGTVPNNAVCLVDEDTPYVVKAEAVEFDNTDTGLSATDVDGAIKEVNSNIIPMSYNASFSAIDRIEYQFRPGYFLIITAYSGTNHYDVVFSDDGRFEFRYNGTVLWTK